MRANRARWPVATMARLLGVSTSGFYAWLAREPSRHACSDALLLARIRTLHASSRGTYGAPRIHAQLAREGVHVGRKRVARLMRMAGLCGASRRRWPHTTRQRAGARRAGENLSNFGADTQREVEEILHAVATYADKTTYAAQTVAALDSAIIASRTWPDNIDRGASLEFAGIRLALFPESPVPAA